MERSTHIADKYALPTPVLDVVDTALRDYPPLVRRLLANRDIRTPEDAVRFLDPAYEAELHDPFLLTDMDVAVERVLRALDGGEHIVVYSDYDCDGIPGGVLLHDFFTAIEHTNFQNYIPHRHREGYGCNAVAVEKLARDGATLIITVDCGITDHAAAQRARELGIDLIITDHHEPGETLPDALAVINPKRDGNYPFDGLCGTGVAYKLIRALITKGAHIEGIANLKSGWEKWWLDVVGIATIADMVPLVDENRVFARYGLMVLRKSRRPGLQQLLRLMRIDQKTLTEDDIGFMIAPRINAASRMDTPEDAFHMLASGDEAIAGAHARHLEKLNNERKGVVAAMVKEAKKRMERAEALPAVLVMGDPEWRPSLAGLVANTLADRYARPAFVWGRDGNSVIKGSCRGANGVSVVTLMREAADVFAEYGGHHASGGFSLTDEGIFMLESRLNEAHQTLTERGDLGGEVEVPAIDAELTLDEVTDTLVREIEQLGPFGLGNPKPLFVFTKITPQRVETFGKGKEHTKLVFHTTRGPREAIAFFKTPEQFDAPCEANEPLSLIAHVERSYFRNRPQLRLRIVDIA